MKTISTSVVSHVPHRIALPMNLVQIPMFPSSGSPYNTSRVHCMTPHISLLTISNSSKLTLTPESPNEEVRDRFLESIDRTLKPHVADKGYDWEYSIEETRRDLWKVQGMVPPMPGSEAELEWVKNNKATEFEPVKGNL
jgi:hypothetical protein